jgi:hypothetical protein
MKKILIIATSVFLIVSCNTAQNNQPKSGFVAGEDTKLNIDPNDTTKRTTILWIDTLLDLGKLPKKGLVDVSFRFKNTGNKPLCINSVSAGCGCTQPEKPATLIEPGKEGIIKAKFNTENQNGQVEKYVTVLSNTNPSDKMLKFRANVIAEK